MSHAFRHLDLFVTESCNLSCPYCFARDRVGAVPMSEDLAERAIDWLCASSAQKVHITFWGGEPLLRLPWLERVTEKFVTQARAAGKTPSLSLPTNATLLRDAALSWIERFNVKVFLSIDGDVDTQAGRPLASGKNSHTLASQGLAKVLARKSSQPTIVRMTVTPNNVAQLPDNVRYFAKQGVRRLMVYPAYDQPWSNADVRAFGAAEQAVADMLIPWIVRAKDPRRLTRLDAWLATLREFAGSRKPRTPRQSISSCGVGHELAALNIDGSWTPCHRFTFYGRASGTVWRMGDLSNGFEPGASDAFRDLRLEHQRGVSHCTDCDLFSLCSMGCVAINYATTGKLTEVPEWACALQRQRIQACRSLHDSLRAHPAYAAYIGQSTTAVLQRQADDMGRRAAKLWQSLSEPRNEP